MPYLTFSTESYSKQHPENQSKGENKKTGYLRQLEQAQINHDDLLEAYKGQVVHGSLTLDESYYHVAPDQQQYNKHQVVTRKLQHDKDEPHWPLLRANQLWAWIVGKGEFESQRSSFLTNVIIEQLITAITHPVGQTEDRLLTEILHYLREIGDSGQAQPNSAFEMSKVIVDYCIGAYGREVVDQDIPSIRQIFSNSIRDIVRRNHFIPC